MADIEKIKDLIRRMTPPCLAVESITTFEDALAKRMNDFTRELLSRIDLLSEDEPADEDLEEAAGNYAMNDLNVFGNQDGWTENGAVYDMVKATAFHFANWQKQQMMKESLECTIIHHPENIYADHSVSAFIPPLHPAADYISKGDKIKLIIIKED